MTTNELIEQLKNADPSGELEVTIGKIPIHFVDHIPAYYDGTLQILEHDPKLAPYYDICGARYTDKGSHLTIHSLSIEDAIFEDVNLPVKFDCEGLVRQAEKMKLVESFRQRSKKIHRQVDGWIQNKKKNNGS